MVTFESPVRGVGVYRDTPYAHIAQWLIRDRWNLDEIVSLFSLEKPIYPIEQKVPRLDGSYRTVEFAVLDGNIPLAPLNIDAPTFCKLPMLLEAKAYPLPIERTEVYYRADEPVTLSPYLIEQEAYLYNRRIPEYKKNELIRVALAFFLAQLNQDDDLQNKIVIFDAPFSSQDGFRRAQTALEVLRCGEKCAQIVVLSHDGSFLKLVADKAKKTCPTASIKTLKMSPVGVANTALTELDLDAMLSSETATWTLMLREYYQHGIKSGHSCSDVVQKIRPLLEGHCKNTCITLFNDQDNLSDILAKIRNGDASHPLWPSYNELHDINEYTSHFHHHKGAGGDTMVEEELLGYVSRTLKLTGVPL